MSLSEQLSGSIHVNDIKEWASKVQSSANEELVNELYNCLFSKDKRIANNAAWICSHFNKAGIQWLQTKQSMLIEEVMHTNDATQRRLLLTILQKQHFNKQDIQTNFLDFCLDNIQSPQQPVAIRTLSVYLAYQQCLAYPELLSELKIILHLLEQEPLLPALKHAKQKVLNAISTQ